MPAVRKPTAQLELNGAFRKDPQRRRTDPATAGPLGEPPASMPIEMHAIWNELADIAPLNVLRVRDRWIVETAVRLMYRQRTDDDMPTSKLARLLWCLSHLGMTPSDASKVHAPKEKPDSAFGKFARKLQEARKETKPVH